MKTDTASFLESLSFTAEESFQDSNIYDFHPDFIAAVDSFIDGFHEFLAARDVEILDSPRSFGGNVYFSLSDHGVGFWDSAETEHLQALLEEYSASLPGRGKYRFEGLGYSLSRRRGGKIDLAILAKFLPASRRALFGMVEPAITPPKTPGISHHNSEP